MGTLTPIIDWEILDKIITTETIILITIIGKDKEMETTIIVEINIIKEEAIKVNNKTIMHNKISQTKIETNNSSLNQTLTPKNSLIFSQFKPKSQLYEKKSLRYME